MKRFRTNPWVCLLLGLFALFSFGSASRESLTYDEAIHITSGFIFWKTGSYLDPLHPPLLRLWAAIPLLFCRLGWPDLKNYHARDIWIYCFMFLNHNRLPVDTLVLLSRSMMILLGIGLGYLVWRWSKEVFGEVGAAASLTAYCFLPPILAFSHYVTTDFGPPVFSTLALYMAWRWRDQSKYIQSWILGVCSGLALSAKFTEVLLLPMLAFSRIRHWVAHQEWRKGMTWTSEHVLLFSFGLASVFLLCYRFFERNCRSTHSRRKKSHGRDTESPGTGLCSK